MAVFYKLLPLLITIAVAALFIKVLSPWWFRYKLKKLMKFRPSISVTDASGFSIFEADNVVKKFHWKDIDKIELTGSEVLKLYFKDTSMLTMWKRDYTGWLALIKTAPATLPVNDAFAKYKDEYFSNLSCCKVCGKIAVKNDECPNCIADTYEKYCKDMESDGEKIQTEREFLRENQLDWFTAFIDEGKVDFHSKEILYDDCPNWTPLVTAAEVIQYDKEMEA
ncbi:hypothetical protein [Ferruginibacter sp.]